MTDVQFACESGLLRVVQAMEAALREASGEGAPPLPPLVNRGGTQTASSSGAATASIDTALRRREKWEASVREKMTPLATRVQDACADLHHALGDLSELCLDEQQFAAARDGMRHETAVLEQKIVEVYSVAARAESDLLENLKREAAADASADAAARSL